MDPILLSIIFLILVAGGQVSAGSQIPAWVIWSSFVAIGLGTLAGGWRIVDTLGFKLTKLDSRGGFCAESGGSISCCLLLVLWVFQSALLIPLLVTYWVWGQAKPSPTSSGKLPDA